MLRRRAFGFDGVESEALLLVEGIDDARFLDAFLKRELDRFDVQIAQVGGKDNFRPFIVNTLARADGLRNLRRLGVMRDADSSPTSAMQSLGAAFRDAALPVPSRPWETVQKGDLAVTVAILPDGTSPGDLEDLCLRSIDNQAMSECIERYIACAINTGAVTAQLSKARLFAYLAVGDVPGLRLGEAADAGVWDWDSPAFTQLADFLRSL